MAHDVFISHSSQDKAVADALCHALEASRIRCWMAPRDIRPGHDWTTELVRAIESSRIMVLVFSDQAQQSRAVRNEIMAAMNANVHVIPFRIDSTALDPFATFHLQTVHWLDASSPPLERHIKALSGLVAGVLNIEPVAVQPDIERRSDLENTANPTIDSPPYNTARYDEIIVPDIDAAGGKAKVIVWRRSVGDTVDDGEVVVELETRSAVIELTSPVAGQIVDIVHPVGAKGLLTGTILARVSSL